MVNIRISSLLLHQLAPDTVGGWVAMAVELNGEFPAVVGGQLLLDGVLAARLLARVP